MDKKRKIFVYGTLRKGNYNHVYLHFNLKTKYLGTTILKKAKMFNLGYYPCVVLTGNPTETVVGELYEFIDPEFEDLIRQMELSARYIEKIVTIDREKYSIYIFENEPRNAEIIDSGDWNTANKRI